MKKNQTKDIHFAFRLTHSELAELRAKAKERKMTGSDLVRNALQDFYEQAA